MCRPRPMSLTTPVARWLPGTSRLTSVDLPTPLCPNSTLTLTGEQARRWARRCRPWPAVTTGTPSGSYAAVSDASAPASASSGLSRPARSSLVRHSTGERPPSNAATRHRSISRGRAGGEVRAATTTSRSALATTGRSELSWVVRGAAQRAGACRATRDDAGERPVASRSGHRRSAPVITDHHGGTCRTSAPRTVTTDGAVVQLAGGAPPVDGGDEAVRPRLRTRAATGCGAGWGHPGRMGTSSSSRNRSCTPGLRATPAR